MSMASRILCDANTQRGVASHAGIRYSDEYLFFRRLVDCDERSSEKVGTSRPLGGIPEEVSDSLVAKPVHGLPLIGGSLGEHDGSRRRQPRKKMHTVTEKRETEDVRWKR